MPSFYSNGLEINYFDNQINSEDTIIFIHGNSQSLISFRNQLACTKLSKYRLIAFDLPGHGLSGKSGEYYISLFVDTLEKLIHKLEIQNYILAGHSLGGHIALHSLKTMTPKGVFVFGTPPLKKPLNMSAFKKNGTLPLLFKNGLTDNEITQLSQMYYSRANLNELDILDIKRTDPNFRESMFKSFSEGKFSDEVFLLSRFSGLKGIISGTHDTLVNANYIKENLEEIDLWGNSVTEISSSHNMHIEDHDTFNDLLLNFSDAAFEKQIPTKTYIVSTKEVFV